MAPGKVRAETVIQVNELLHLTKLAEMLLLVVASFYVGHQTAKPKEERHWTKIKKLVKKDDDAPPDAN